VFALADKVLEHPLHPSQVGQLVLDLRQAVRGDVTDRRPVGAFLEMQQFGNFLKGEAELLGSFDEADPVDEADRVAAKSPVLGGTGRSFRSW